MLLQEKVLAWKDFKEFYHPHSYLPPRAALSKFSSDLKPDNIGVEISPGGRLHNFVALDLGSFRYVGASRWHKAKSLSSFYKWMSEEFPQAYAHMQPFIENRDITAISEEAWAQ